ncbi:sigma-70 family RNA polymerase sigma factor [Actinophytocola sp. KF-1]
MAGPVDVTRTVEAVWKLESARIVAGLTRLVHDVGLAEELAQDALVAALSQWPAEGVPGNPGAWLTAVAKRRAIDHLRRARRVDVEEDLGESAADEPAGERDDVLRLMFLSCHPVLPTPARVALTLRLLGGLTAAEIARAFLTTEQAVRQRVAAAKRTLAEQQVAFDLPAGAELAERLSSVLEVVYLIFNEGYTATEGDGLLRPELSAQALRLGRLLAELAPGEGEVHGLVALMEIQASRAAARTGPSGVPVPLDEQDRGRWDHLLIQRGFAALLRARDLGGPPGPYVLQAAIAACHAQARTARDTDWARIAALYGALEGVLPTPVVRLNRAVATGRADGPDAGLAALDALADDPALRDYHLLPGVRGDLLARAGRVDEARREFRRAATLTRNHAERDYLLGRAAAGAAPDVPTLAGAVREFLGRADLGPATVRSYGQTMRRLRRSLGDELPLSALTADEVARVFTTAWSDAAARTWNRHRAAIRSFGAWAALPGLDAGLARRDEVTAPIPAIPPALLDRLWGAQQVPLRERVLWSLLHESGAAVSAVLALDVEHLDLDDRRARGRGAWVSWRARTARLLPELVAGRDRGPLFLADRRPGPSRVVAPGDRCPHTGRGRLSYERAEYLFKRHTRTLDPSGAGFTLRQLRDQGGSPGGQGASHRQT